MANERDIHGFPASPTQPVGAPMASRKHSGLLFKRILSEMPKPKPKARAGARTPRAKRKGIEADSKVHFGNKYKFY